MAGTSAGIRDRESKALECKPGQARGIPSRTASRCWAKDLRGKPNCSGCARTTNSAVRLGGCYSGLLAMATAAARLHRAVEGAPEGAAGALEGAERGSLEGGTHFVFNTEGVATMHS